LERLLNTLLDYKAYIFDLDGTLLDTLESLACCYNRVLSHHGYPTHEADAYRYFIGDGAAKCVERCLPKDARKPDIIEQLLVTQREDYLRTWKDQTAPYAGIVDLLTSLVRRNIKMAVLSNKDQMFTESCMTHFFPDFQFDPVVGFSTKTPHKPDPTGAKRIASQWGIPCNEIAFVGDTSMDIETANKSGMDAIGVLWGFRTRKELQDAGAKHVVESPEHILELRP
jgi:phosphoglycolate phosphatase